VIGIFAVVAFDSVVGWRLYVLSRGRVDRTVSTEVLTGRSAG
jgi:hypothetical protein